MTSDIKEKDHQNHIHKPIRNGKLQLLTYLKLSRYKGK